MEKRLESAQAVAPGSEDAGKRASEAEELVQQLSTQLEQQLEEQIALAKEKEELEKRLDSAQAGMPGSEDAEKLAEAE